MRGGHRWQSKNLIIDPKHPSALGVCDDSGFVFNHKDLVKQMEWRGNNYVWTGLLKGPQYIDEPQEQLRPPPVKVDPKPILNPRPPIPYSDLDSPTVVPNPQIYVKINSESLDNDYNLLFNPSTNDNNPVPAYPQLIKTLNKTNWN